MLQDVELKLNDVVLVNLKKENGEVVSPRRARQIGVLNCHASFVDHILL